MISRIKQYLRDLTSRDESPADKPILSIVLIVYDMPAQARNTVTSLLPAYQVEISPQDYEVIIVENESGNPMERGFLDSLPSNFHYYLREESQPSPVNAIQYGAQLARGENICLMIDGARLLTPGVIKNILLGHQMSSSAVVTVPGYHLGREFQQDAVASGYGVEEERKLIRSIVWPEDGYRLFDISCFSGSSAPGFYLPNSESNCISIPRRIWKDLGGCDLRFDMRGGGLVNLDLYKRACEYDEVLHVILPGEGTFHQFHGGVTTGGEEASRRQAFIDASKAQYKALRGVEYENPRTRPVYLGQISPQAQRFVHYSSEMVQKIGEESALIPMRLISRVL